MQVCIDSVPNLGPRYLEQKCLPFGRAANQMLILLHGAFGCCVCFVLRCYVSAVALVS